VLITPHMAGFRADHWEAVTTLFAENLRRFEAGQPLLNGVNKQNGY
jgi:phosphoglycerate dehydrogenase-like enzyme